MSHQQGRLSAASREAWMRWIPPSHAPGPLPRRESPPLHCRNPNSSEEERGKSSHQLLLHHPGLAMKRGMFSLCFLPVAVVKPSPGKRGQTGSRRHQPLFTGHSLSNTQHISQFLSLRAPWARIRKLLPVLPLQSHFIGAEGPLPQLKDTELYCCFPLFAKLKRTRICRGSSVTPALFTWCSSGGTHSFGNLALLSPIFANITRKTIYSPKNKDNLRPQEQRQFTAPRTKSSKGLPDPPEQEKNQEC